MDLIKFLDEFTTDNLKETKTSRKDALMTFGSLSKKAAIAAIPFGLGAAFTTNSMARQSSADPVAALQLALTLEYLEDEFYDLALQSGVIPSGRPETVYMQISKHEQAHVTFLKAGLEGAGVTPVSKPEFDFTAGGAFDPFNNYEQLLALSQAFEDTGVRAYKGQAGNLMGSDFLTVGLQIHSVEARHASEVRRLRGLKGWITRKERGAGMPEATQPVYDGEQNTTQAGVNVAGLSSGLIGNVEDAVTQAYDEPINAGTADAIASLFIKS
jgi:hypothetical protein